KRSTLSRFPFCSRSGEIHLPRGDRPRRRRGINRKTLVFAISYQLPERLQFVRQPDPTVASLLFDLATLESSTGTLESALDLLSLAAQYGYPSHRILPLRTQSSKVILYAHWKRRLITAAAIAIPLALFI